MTGNYLNRILSLNAKHALYREDGKWYHNLTSFPGVLFDKSGYVIFESLIDYKSNPKLQIKKDLHIIGGIEHLEQYRRFSLKEMQLIKGVNMSSKEEASREEETIRILREVDIILRKQVLVGKVKKLYENTCQICDAKIQVGFNKFYSEVHHIIPLGRPHNGKDRLDNMICVCPNCHILLDFHAIRLERNKLKSCKHEISEDSINYYNVLVERVKS